MMVTEESNQSWENRTWTESWKKSYAPNSYDAFHDNLNPCKIEPFQFGYK